MAFKQSVQHAQGVHGFVERVLKDRGAAREPLLRHQNALPQGLLQQAGPALVFVEANAAVGTVGGIRAVAVGVGVAQAENVLFHMQCLLLSRRWRMLSFLE